MGGLIFEEPIVGGSLYAKTIIGQGTNPHTAYVVVVRGRRFLKKNLRLRQFASDRDKTLSVILRDIPHRLTELDFLFFDFGGTYERFKIVAKKYLTMHNIQNYHSLYSILNFDWLIYLQITACK